MQKQEDFVLRMWALNHLPFTFSLGKEIWKGSIFDQDPRKFLLFIVNLWRNKYIQLIFNNLNSLEPTKSPGKSEFVKIRIYGVEISELQKIQFTETFELTSIDYN
eukprot:TRINITY_DN23361_c0_g1_i1.p2 TRINITY_DN23361_c0_g1~~TRINITY_DN23361_c0_g1_i1.p2  ORF type:complete len:105 (-),score=4.28 TRINITY_DN23361_c0_g1_i1:305-619(-)